ncbi:MAG: hypothetical protein JSR59_00510 [Proteobacteria bacterium]|nr:hypothetical protein [Pseudomonadota bacterium]
MSDNITENLVGVDELLRTLAGSCLAAAQQVEQLSNNPLLDRSVRYIVPSFNISVKLSFTKTGNEVKGILFWKKTEGDSTEALSSIDMQIVAVPRTPSDQ